MRPLRILLSFLLAVISVQLSAQVTDDFSDGNFTLNPTWSGDDVEWEVLGQRLHLNGNAAGGVSHLSTPSVAINNGSWEFDVELLFNPSGSNFVDVYLTSDIADLEGAVNGYFVRLGGTTDEVSLYKSTGGTPTEIIDGLDTRLAVTNPVANVRVTRDAAGLWTLESDTSGTGTNYFTEGSVTDTDHGTSAFFGISTQYTSTRFQWCYLDNVNVSGTGFVDTVPPVVIALTATGASTVDVLFNELVDVATAQNTGNYLLNGSLNPVSATVVNGDSARVSLDFGGNTFGVCQIQTLAVSNVDDRFANTIVPYSGDFVYAIPVAAGFKDVLINEIFADPTPAPACIPAAEYVELYNAGNDPVDLQNWTFSDGGTPQIITNTSFLLCPGEYVILCADTALFNPFGQALEMSLPALNNGGDPLGLRSGTGVLVDSVTYSDSWYQDPVKAQGGWSLELINPTDTCAGALNWIATIDPCGGTPGTQNSVFNNSPDVTAPALVSAVPTGATTVQVCFDEPVDAVQAANPALYSADNGLGTATAAVPVGPDFLCVDLTFGTPITQGVLYTLTATGVQDCNGNSGTGSQGFLLPAPAAFKDVIFNELMPDPDSTVTNMPPVEFVELYNRSGTIYDLAGWTFSDIGTPQTMGNFVLQPGAYVILCKASDTAYFSGLPYLGLGSLPSLNNAGDQLGLRDANGTLIDSLEYDDSMYQDPSKANGGWSLELINPNDTCSRFGNWIASNDPDGGTPGQQNSVYNTTPDIVSPTLTGIQVTSATSLQVCFDETMDASTLATLANYSVNNGLSVVAAVAVQPLLNCVDLTLSAPVDTGTIYTVTFTNLTDCAGNSVGILTGDFVLGGTAAPFQVVINEIFADESPSVGLPDAEFIEVYNAGNTVVDLGGWQLTDRTATIGTLPSYNLFPGDYLILCANADVDTFAVHGPVLGVSNFPSLNNASDSLELYNGSGDLIDYVYYQDEWYRDPVKEDGGWTLERIDASFTCLNGGNWLASTAAIGGTPGAVNSVAGTFADAEAPGLAAGTLLGATVVRLYFDEVMDPATLADPSNYTIDQGVGNPIAATAAGAIPQAVDLLLAAPLDTNVIYCVTVSGVTDCPGNLIGTDNSVCFGIPLPAAQGDIVINEILFNPYTGGSDFVELYNVSDKIIDLSELNIGEYDEANDSIFNADPISTLPTLLLPQSYIALTADKQFQLDTYLPEDPDAILEMRSFPSYDDNEGYCIIYTDSGLVLDKLMYLDDWQFPNLDDKNGVSLERHDFFRPTQDPDNWHSAASSVLYATPGYRNSQVLVPDGDAEVFVEPETFSPDQDGFDDVTAINYNFTTSGWNARVTIFDNKGRLVRRLQENTLLGTEGGTFTWDGTDPNGHKVDIGIYVILFEASNPVTGEVKKFKLGCVVAAKL